MRRTVLSVALIGALASNGCTVLGLTVGAIADTGAPARPGRPAPVEISGAPGSAYVAMAPAPKPEHHMSGAAKGALVGLVIDLVVIGATAYAISQIDWCLYACEDEGY
jgi:hypothetical protein